MRAMLLLCAITAIVAVVTAQPALPLPGDLTPRDIGPDQPPIDLGDFSANGQKRLGQEWRARRRTLLKELQVPRGQLTQKMLDAARQKLVQEFTYHVQSLRATKRQQRTNRAKDAEARLKYSEARLKAETEKLQQLHQAKKSARAKAKKQQGEFAKQIASVSYKIKKLTRQNKEAQEVVESRGKGGEVAEGEGQREGDEERKETRAPEAGSGVSGAGDDDRFELAQKESTQQARKTTYGIGFLAGAASRLPQLLDAAGRGIALLGGGLRLASQ